MKIYKELIQTNVKNKDPNQNMGRRPEWTLSQRRYTDGQQARDMILNITSPQKCKSKPQ